MTISPRMTTVLLYLRLVLGVASIVTAIVVDTAAHQLPWATILFLHLVVWTVSTYTGRPLMETREAGLDEREISIRNSSSWWGLTILCGLTTVLAVVLIVAADTGGAFVDALSQRSGYILIGIVLTTLSIPSLIGQGALNSGDSSAPLFVGLDDDMDDDMDDDETP